MRVLVTGSEGLIGRGLIGVLQETGHEVRTFDRVARKRGHENEHLIGDLRDVMAVRQAAQGMDAVIHAGAIANDQRGRDDEVLSVNVQGTLNVLLACLEVEVERMVYFSSVNALGCVGGHRPSQYLPIDDDYPHHPMTPYQLSKHLAEEACKAFSDRHDLITLCLRPVAVFSQEAYSRYFRKYSPEQRAEWNYEQYWAYVDLRDVCRAALLCLQAQGVKHDAFLLSAADTSINLPSEELVAKYYADTPWLKMERSAYFAEHPRRALLDTRHAREALGWEPEFSWLESN